MTIKRLTNKDTSVISHIHLSVLRTSSTVIGKRYIEYLYTRLLTTNGHEIYGIYNKKSCIGFIAYSNDITQTIKAVPIPLELWFFRDLLMAVVRRRLNIFYLVSRLLFEYKVQKKVFGMNPYILTFGVLPEYQQMGVGSTLLNYIFKKNNLKKINSWYVDTEQKNYKALGFYKKHGFKKLYQGFGNILFVRR